MAVRSLFEGILTTILDPTGTWYRENLRRRVVPGPIWTLLLFECVVLLRVPIIIHSKFLLVYISTYFSTANRSLRPG